MSQRRIGYHWWPWQLACSRTSLAGSAYVFSTPLQSGTQLRSTGEPVALGVPLDGLSLSNSTAKAAFYLPSLVGVDLNEEMSVWADLFVTTDMPAAGDYIKLECAVYEVVKGYNGTSVTAATPVVTLTGPRLTFTTSAANWQNRVVGYSGSELVIPAGTIGSAASALWLAFRVTEVPASSGDPVLLFATGMNWTRAD